MLNALPDLAQLRALVTDVGSPLADTMLARRTQTNEPARCATLLPALAQLPAPLALIEVGASAGLTLLFDRYSYDYSGHHIEGDDRLAPTLRCQPRGPVPLPDRVPQIVWRVGLDLNPLDIGNDEDVRWLRCLVWPGEADREERLTGAIAAARRDPPTLHRGDLLTDLPALVAQAPRDATVVVYHSAVLAYLTPQERISFADTVQSLGVVWLSNEGPRVLPNLPAPAHHGAPFVLTRDGRSTLAVCDSHGTWVQWLINSTP